jgi:hypothetical protein
MMGCCEGKMKMKVQKYKKISWPADWLSTYRWQKLSIAIGVGYLQSNASCPS